MNVSRHDVALVSVVALSMLVLAAVLLLLGEPWREACKALVVATSILAVMAWGWRDMRQEQDRLRQKVVSAQRRSSAELDGQFRQLESLLAVLFALKPVAPLPATRGWAASPDLLKKIVELVFSERPAVVVEASSGVSTLVIAYCLKALGAGRVVSLEHDETYALQTRRNIELHGLAGVATVLHAPLVDHAINGQSWRWYDLTQFVTEGAIDLLVVDGPPDRVQALARYPALPILLPRMSARAVVLLDDGNREDEKTAVDRWQREFPQFASEFLALEKGAYVLRRTTERSAHGTSD